MKNHACSKRERGFTLIEVMIAVVIMTILGAVAYPSYVAYVQRSNRSTAKAALEQTAQYMERQFTVNNAYDTVLPASYLCAPLNAPCANKKYDLTLATTGAPATTFTLTATPINTTGIDPTCGTLLLDNLGNQRANGNPIASPASATDVSCWQK
jgi:type IV pilus assembly protein PilE